MSVKEIETLYHAPWSVYREGEGFDALCIMDAGEQVICDFVDSDKGPAVDSQNARLLRASPEMLALLEFWLKESIRSFNIYFKRKMSWGYSRNTILKMPSTRKYIDAIRNTKQTIRRIRGEE